MHGQICDIKISKVTLAAYLKEYVAGGIDVLKETMSKGKRNLLLGNAASIEDYFEKYMSRTLKEARAKIEELVSIKRTLPQVLKFFIRIKLKRCKVKAVSAKALTDEKQHEQREFINKELTLQLEEAANGKREVFMDAAHSVHQTCMVAGDIVYSFSLWV